jgi:hypothetical protein
MTSFEKTVRFAIHLHFDQLTMDEAGAMIGVKHRMAFNLLNRLGDWGVTLTNSRRGKYRVADWGPINPGYYLKEAA